MDSVLDPQSASVDYIYKIIENMIEQGDAGYEPPEELDNLPVGVQLMTQAYQQGKLQGLPESILSLFRKWIEEADALTQRMQPPQPQSAPQGQLPQGPMPQGAAPVEPAPEQAPMGPPVGPGTETIQ